MDFYQELCSAAGNGSVLQNEPMSAHTTFRIGGPADYFVTPTSAEEIGNVIETQFLTSGNWNFGSAISMIMAVIIMISMYITKKVDRNASEGGGQG